MGRKKSEANAIDPATGKPLSPGVGYRGPGQYRARKLVNGKPDTKTFETDKLAREWREETEASARKGEYVDRRPLDKLTLGDLSKRFVKECMQDGGDRRGAAEDRGHIPAIDGDAIAKLPLSKLTPASVRDFRERQLAAGYAKGTVVKRMNLIQCILKQARSEWGVPLKENVASGENVRRPKGADKKRKRRLRVPSPAALRLAVARGEDPPITEEQALINAVTKSSNKWDLLLTRWAIAQGTRQGEALGLHWGDVDFEARTITLYGRLGLGTKNDEHQEEIGPEVRPLMPEAMAILKAIEPPEGADPNSLVFPVGDHMAFRVRYGRLLGRAARAMTGIMKDLKYLRDLKYHDLRHEATSRLAKVYKVKEDLRRVTGHKDLKSLDRYYQPDMTELAMVAEEYELARLAGVAMPPEGEKTAAD